MTRTPEQDAAVPVALYTATRNAMMVNRGLDIARVILSEAVRTATEVDEIETVREHLNWIFERIEADNDEVRDAMRDAGSVLP